MQPFFEHFEKDIFKFQTILNKILDVGNDERAKSQAETLCISGHTKMTISDRFWRFQILHCSLFQINTFVMFAQPKT